MTTRPDVPDPGPAHTVPVRVKPGASRTFVGGAYPGPYGPAVVVAVSAPAIEGRATKAVLVALAQALGVRPRQLSIKTGLASRDKLVSVTDPPVDLPIRLDRLRLRERATG